MLPLISLIPPAPARSAAAPPQRYSYAAVLGAVAVGLVAPNYANWLLGPVLLAGMALLGVAHGACDQFVVPATHPALARGKGRYWAVFLGGYLGLAAVVGLLWWQQPGLTLMLFFGLTACTGARAMRLGKEYDVASGWPTACCAVACCLPCRCGTGPPKPRLS